jgi:hypothetical protein
MLQAKAVKVKGKVHPTRGHKGPEGDKLYSCTLCLALTLDGGGWSTPRPGRFTPGKETRYPLYRRLGGPQVRTDRIRTISPPPPPGFDAGPSSPYRVAIPTVLFRSTTEIVEKIKTFYVQFFFPQNSCVYEIMWKK